MEGLVRIELTTRCLKGTCSTTELQARILLITSDFFVVSNHVFNIPLLRCSGRSPDSRMGDLSGSYRPGRLAVP